MTNETRNYTVSSGNVFADAGLPNADERLARARIMHRVATLIKDSGLTQREAAALLGVPQPHISLLLRGRMSSFSLERLLHMLTALGNDVTIAYQPARSARGHLHIVDTEANGNAGDASESAPTSEHTISGARRRKLAERQAHYLAELERESGPLTDDELEAARQAWRGNA